MASVKEFSVEEKLTSLVRLQKIDSKLVEVAKGSKKTLSNRDLVFKQITKKLKNSIQPNFSNRIPTSH
jgi:hypothetical protein